MELNSLGKSRISTAGALALRRDLVKPGEIFGRCFRFLNAQAARQSVRIMSELEARAPACWSAIAAAFRTR